MSPSRYGAQRLETTLRPELTLHLTQEMRLRLEILQANILSLEEMLSLEVQQNPALEVLENEPEGERERTSEEFSLDDFYPHNLGLGYEETEERSEPGSSCADRSSLEEYLMLAIAREFSGSEADYRIAHYILDDLDEDGFLHEDSSSIAQALGTTEDSAEVRIIKEGYDTLLQKRITSLAKMLRLPTEVIVGAFETIASLDPKPGRNLHEVACRSVQPDLTIRYREGKLEVVVNEGPLPGLRLSAKFKEILRNPKRFSKEDVEFAKRKLESAQLFIKGIIQRRETLYHLAQDVLLHNYAFFNARTQQPKSLLMKDIADKLDLHVSTISRAVRDKYIETPVGIFPLRSFFAKGEQNPTLSKLAGIIACEDKTNPFTDEQIAQQLAVMGFKLSRRTVTKYRLKLNIPDRFQRKALAQ
jgi:DNA-directed RNA polymerase specialized sigma54-like protein